MSKVSERPTSMPPAVAAVRIASLMLPVIVLAAGLVGWELVVRIESIPPYVLPGPVLVARTLAADWGILSASLLTTLLTTLEGFIAAAIGGIALALLFNQSKWLEYALFPLSLIHI